MNACPHDNRECGWFGCHRPECEQFCAGLPADDFEYATEDLTPREPDRHRGWFRRLRDLVNSPGGER